MVETGRTPSARRAQGGRGRGQPSRGRMSGFLMTRALLVVGILLVMLVVPIYLNRDRDLKKEEINRQETAASTLPARSSASAEAPAIGFGTSLAMVSGEGAPSADLVAFACQGEPAPVDKPIGNACNPGTGDTSCSAVLPVLCVLPNGQALPTGVDGGLSASWVRGELGATAPVMGAVLASEAAANARCESELGSGWRMASLGDASQGYTRMVGVRGGGIDPLGRSRHWVRVPNSQGNCWSGS